MMVGILVSVAAVSAIAVWYHFVRPREVPCAVDLEATQEHFHAHVALEGFEVGAGDEVLVHGTPSHIPLGAQLALSLSGLVSCATFLNAYGVSSVMPSYAWWYHGAPPALFSARKTTRLPDATISRSVCQRPVTGPV